MTNTLTRKPQSKSKSAKQIARRIRHLEVLAGNVHRFVCYSMTRQGHEVRHHQEIDLETGCVQCSCEHFLYRQAARGANLVTWMEGEAAAPCKHLQRASEWLLRHDYLNRFLDIRLRPCHSCGVADADHELADDNGHATNGFICADCVTRARMMNSAPEPEFYVGYSEWLDELEDETECESSLPCPCCNGGAAWKEVENWSGPTERLVCEDCGDVTEVAEREACQ